MTFYERAKELVSQMTLEEKMSQMRYDAPAIERLEIPAYNWWNECLHGVARQGAATVFPQAIGMAASFDTDMMYRVATVISDEARAKYNEFRKLGDTGIYQGLTFWSPNINIFRDPRWGRGHETYGEDPYLTGRMGTAFIKGLQGDGKYRKLDATIKHYAVHSGPEGLRHGFDAVVSDKDLYETYLWAFKYCIDNADPSAVMGAYNRVGGEPCCGSKRLLTDILYGEFGFNGYVVSDCGAINDIHVNHKYTKDAAESAALAVNSGCQLNCGNAFLALQVAFNRGLISEETITAAVEKLFEARFRLGMFDDDCEYDNISVDIVECEAHTALNREMARKSTVLLKNDGILPLKPDATVAVIGPNADSKTVLLGNYNGTPSRYTTLLRGIQDASEGKVIYARGCHMYKDTLGHWEEQPTNEALLAAMRADVAVLCMGLDPSMEGEEGDAYNGANSGDKKDIALPAVQLELIEKIVGLGKPTVFVNVSGSCVDLSYADGNCNAVLQCFYPGAEGGNALADILYGKCSPSGRLPVSFYRSVDDLPQFEDYSMENRTYKFFKGKCVYDFGHGLTYSEIKEEWVDEDTVILRNLGEFDTDYSVLKFRYVPHKELCDFKCVHLKKGETLTVK
ncbi:MAG: glycoside hydrolase family 3 C-terminal domain-containing protein, partial [Clostridia bacterium]|nr:glycoside hydrolase family 3 C-terminal domain-containing protein [Clostridia bacterium]